MSAVIMYGFTCEIIQLPWQRLTFGAKFLITINQPKTHDFDGNLSPVILKGNQMVHA